MSAPRRRFFWGQTLSQALARAARQFGLPPERLAYRVRAKRHGYVKHPRAVLIEVDPDSPALAANAAPPAVVAAPERRPAPRPTSRPAAVEERDEEIWDQPDAESELAASEAARRLLAFAGLDLAAEVAAADDRLLLTLRGADEPALRRGGAALLDAFEALLPRAVVSLCGRRVRCRVDGAGVRAAREETLRAAAREGAARARERGEHLLEPLAPAERRLVHLTLESEADLATESLGRGQLKRVRIYLRPAASSD